MDGITVIKDEEGQVREVRYLTDDRDKPEGRRHELVIGWGNNGDWYIYSAPEGEKSVNAVRLCTSGGASSSVPGLTVLVSQMFHRIAEVGGAERK